MRDPSIDPELDQARGDHEEREIARLDGRTREQIAEELLTVRELYRESEARHARTLARLREIEAQAERWRGEALTASEAALRYERRLRLEEQRAGEARDRVRAAWHACPGCDLDHVLRALDAPAADATAPTTEEGTDG